MATDSETLRGQFLIAGKSLRDPNFFKSVVLIVEHNQEGTLGLVINQPTEVNIADVLNQHMEVPQTSEVVHLGGPVSTNELFVLHNSHLLDPDSARVVHGVYMGTHPQLFEEAVTQADEEKNAGKTNRLRYRIFCGCAGWGPRQLEGELTRADWLIHPATEEDVFHRESHVLWDDLYQQALRAESLVAHLPGDPGLN